jgi:hypothetical protein
MAKHACSLKWCCSSPECSLSRCSDVEVVVLVDVEALAGCLLKLLLCVEALVVFELVVHQALVVTGR